MLSTEPIPLEATDCIVCGGKQATVEARGRDYLYRTSAQEYCFVSCNGCGHLYLNPRPTIAAIDRIYPLQYSSFSGRFSDSDSWVAFIKDRVLLRRFSMLTEDLSPHFRLLDVGCGDGRFLLMLRRLFPEARLTGMDWHFSPSVAEDLDRANIERLTGTVEEAPMPEAAFDIVTMNQLIEHLWNPRRALDRCRQALRPNGRIAIETPNPQGYDRRLLFKGGAWGSYYWPRHLNLFSRAHLTRLVEEAGLAGQQWKPLLAPPCWTYSIRSMAIRAGYRGGLLHRVLSDTNPAVLGLFAAIDLLALCMGATTSNQKLVAVHAK